MTPKSYEPVKWRCTLPGAADSLGIGFDTADGTPIRLRLDLENARHLSQTLAEELWNHPADLPPGFKFEPYPVCPRCGWNLRQQPEQAKSDEPKSQEDKPVAEYARMPGVCGNDTDGVKTGVQGVIDPLAKADEETAERDERRGRGWKRGQQASAAQQKDPNANNDKHLIPVFKSKLGQRIIHWLRGRRP